MTYLINILICISVCCFVNMTAIIFGLMKPITKDELDKFIIDKNLQKIGRLRAYLAAKIYYHPLFPEGWNKENIYLWQCWFVFLVKILTGTLKEPI